MGAETFRSAEVDGFTLTKTRRGEVFFFFTHLSLDLCVFSRVSLLDILSLQFNVELSGKILEIMARGKMRLAEGHGDRRVGSKLL